MWVFVSENNVYLTVNKKAGHLQRQDVNTRLFWRPGRSWRHVRKTEIIDMEPSRLWMDVVAFLETRLSDSGSVMERNFLFFWRRKSPDETREHGVGFYGQEYPAGIHRLICRWRERIFSLQLPSSVVLVSLITAYAPILSSPGEAKDKLYHELAITIKGNHWEGATNCSSSMTSTPEL